MSIVWLLREGNEKAGEREKRKRNEQSGRESSVALGLQSSLTKLEEHPSGSTAGRNPKKKPENQKNNSKRVFNLETGKRGLENLKIKRNFLGLDFWMDGAFLWDPKDKGWSGWWHFWGSGFSTRSWRSVFLS